MCLISYILCFVKGNKKQDKMASYIFQEKFSKHIAKKSSSTFKPNRYSGIQTKGQLQFPYAIHQTKDSNLQGIDFN